MTTRDRTKERPAPKNKQGPERFRDLWTRNPGNDYHESQSSVRAGERKAHPPKDLYKGEACFREQWRASNFHQVPGIPPQVDGADDCFTGDPGNPNLAIDKLIFYARNPRKNDAAVDRMCASDPRIWVQNPGAGSQ